MKRKNSHKIEGLLVLTGMIMIGIAMYHILPDYLDNKRSAAVWKELERKYLEAEEEEIEEDTRERKKDWWFTDVAVAFGDLKKENEEIIAWLRFDDADDLHISYPVLYSGDDEKYLRSNLYGEEHIAGSLFLEGQNKPNFSDYYAIIYGHNMRDGSMFGDLDLYKETDFWKKHPYFTLYTENKVYRYEIFSSQMASVSGKVFRIGYIPGKEYEDFIDEMVRDSLIDTGIQPQNDDRILTLSTCTGNGYDSRMTVHAVCVDEQINDPDRLL